MVASRVETDAPAESESIRKAQHIGLPLVSARDRRTLEIRQFLPLPRRHEQAALYVQDAYFFIPQSFAINSETFSRADFYRDADSFLRLNSPGLNLSELADLDCKINPAAFLKRQLPLLMTESAASASALTMLAQLFGAELVDACTAEVRELQKHLQSAPLTRAPADLEEELDRICRDVMTALYSMRKLRADAGAYRGIAPASLLCGLSYAEEFACARVQEELAALAQLVQKGPALCDGSGTAMRMRLRIGEVSEMLSRYRRDQGFGTPWEEAPEYYSYRMELLKNEIEQALFVDTRALTHDPFYRNSVAMVAAGLAATWATLAQLPLLSGNLSSENRLLVIGFAILAYVLKDRIKEWSRALLSGFLMRWDHDRRLVGNALLGVGFGEFSGSLRERVSYLSERQIPKDVLALRTTHHTVRGLTSEKEQVLHHRQRFEFRCGSAPVPPAFGVEELFRLSLDEVIKRLDDAGSTVAYFDPKTGQFPTASVPKVYHLNLVLVVADLIRNEEVRSRTRVVLNQQGVVRVDEVEMLDDRFKRDASREAAPPR